MSKNMLAVEVKRHPASAGHWLCVITTARGYCYFCTWAGDRPSEETVLRAWREDRRTFAPYRG